MYVCVHIHIYAYTYIYTHTYYIYVDTCIYIYPHIFKILYPVPPTQAKLSTWSRLTRESLVQHEKARTRTLGYLTFSCNRGQVHHASIYCQVSFVKDTCTNRALFKRDLTFDMCLSTCVCVVPMHATSVWCVWWCVWCACTGMYKAVNSAHFGGVVQQPWWAQCCCLCVAV